MTLHKILRYLFFFSAILGICAFTYPVLPMWWPVSHRAAVSPLESYTKHIPIQQPIAVKTKNITVPTQINPQQVLKKSSTWIEQKIQALKTSTTNIDTNILRLSLIAYQKAQQSGIAMKQQLLTVIDYSKPSTMKRLWVFDLKNNKTVFNTWVAHGVKSGGVKPTSFSNVDGSLKSSIGVFLTDHTYYGGRGYSLRIKGLERGFNDHVYERNVVFHGAPYMNPDTIRKHGQAGRSWGCPAVSSSLIKPLINTIKDKSLLIVYYPDKNWLKSSRFLT